MQQERLDPIAEADAALDLVVSLQAEIDALAARRTEALAAFERAFEVAYPPAAERFTERARRAELACALRLPERSAERMLGEARVLVGRLPATLAALGAGLFSYRHAQVMVDETAGLTDADTAAVERLALASAPTQTASRFARTVRRLRERRDPATMIARATTAFAARAVTLDPAPDGMAYLTAHLNAVDAAAIHERLTGAAIAVRDTGDPRTVGALRADLLADALLDRHTDDDTEHILGVFQGITPNVVVTVPVETLLGGDEPANLEGVGPIDAATARRLTAEAPSLYRLLTHPETGAALSLGRTRYQVPESLRMWLRVRDGSCRFPMCGIGTRRSDLDHTVDWQHGGPTDHGNLAHLSRGHHTLKHHGGWSVTQPQPGRLLWTSYLGREYETLPDTG